MKGYASITITIRIAVSFVILVGVWVSLNSYVDTMKNIEMTRHMQDVAELIDAKVLCSLKTLQSPENSYVKDKMQLPDFGEYYCVSLICNSDDMLMINASVPVRGINFIIKDYINCSGMTLSGTLLPDGKRCILANRTGSSVRIDLVNDCGSV
jgi:hypothetical protein